MSLHQRSLQPFKKNLPPPHNPLPPSKHLQHIKFSNIITHVYTFSVCNAKTCACEKYQVIQHVQCFVFAGMAEYVHFH